MKRELPGGPTSITILQEKPPELGEAQLIVGGYVELITLPDGRQMLVDEDGHAKQLPVNNRASQLAQRTIVGRALILEGKARWI